MKKSLCAMGTLALSALFCADAGAQPVGSLDTIIVFDGSGSMWGQIDGRSKIEIARETLSTVLSEVPNQTRIGMIAYGHRQKGVCSDIETIVPVGPANSSVPAMIDVANGLQPKGKTPLSDAVRMAAEELKFTENAATVILVTDGIETCNADPCALASELERLGVGFTAHVVGFGLSEDEGRQVQCLADNTGGLYLSANNADELGNALRRTVQAEAIEPSDDDFGDPIATTRNVRFIFTDTPDSKQIGIRQLSGSLQRADGLSLENADFKFAYPEASGNSATATLEPGNYIARLERKGGSRGGYSTNFEFEIPAGEGEHVIEASLSGALIIRPFLNPNVAYEPKSPPKSALRSKAWAYFSVFPVVEGEVAEEPIVSEAYDNLSFPLASGDYVIRGNIDRTTSAEKFVSVDGVTEVDFSFDVTRVFVDAREADGTPVKRQTTYWYDKVPSGRNYWVSGHGVSKGEVIPFYLPTGEWVVNVGGEGYGKRRSVQLISVPGDYRDIRIQIGESEVLDPDDKGYLSSPAHQACREMLIVKYKGCLVEKLEVKKADLGVAPEPEASDGKSTMQPASADPVDMSDVRLNFGIELNGKVYAAIDFPPNDKGLARIALADGWCGDVSACSGSIAGISPEILAALDSGRTETFIDSWDVGRVTVNPDGQRDTIDVLERGKTKRFILIRRLGGQARMEGSPDTKAAKPNQLQQAVLPNKPMFGIFRLDETGASVEEITADFAHLQSCQRRQMVVYPDGFIALKQFVPPTNNTDNPFKTVASGQCTISGKRYQCNIQEAESGQAQVYNFEQIDLGNNHFQMMEDDKNGPTLAASCFYPGGEVSANEVMPNGRPLAELVMERMDGKAPGFSYDADNRVQQ